MSDQLPRPSTFDVRDHPEAFPYLSGFADANGAGLAVAKTALASQKRLDQCAMIEGSNQSAPRRANVRGHGIGTEVQMHAKSTERLPLIGRAYVIIENLTKRVQENVRSSNERMLPWSRGERKRGLNIGHVTTAPYPTADSRGFYFDVRVLDDKSQPTGFIARVTVELDRMDDGE